MGRLWSSVACVLALGLVLADSRAPIRAAATEVHGYFDALVSSPAHWKSYSLRSQAQIDSMSMSGTSNAVVRYDPAADAARVTIPAFHSWAIAPALAAAVDATETVWTLTAWDSNLYAGRAIRIDREVVLVAAADSTNRTIRVTRGQLATVPAPHAVGAALYLNTNSLSNQVRLPLGTEDGHTYLFVWDGYWTPSYVGTGLLNHKTFQFSTGSKDSLWLEPQTRFAVAGTSNMVEGFNPATDVAVLEMRSYLALGGPQVWSEAYAGYLGPTVTKREPINPITQPFILKPAKWTRFFVRIRQRANDYDLMDYWVADEDREPVQIYSSIPLSVGSIYKFWIEFNTSTDRFVRGDARDLTAYLRNFVALRNPSNVQELLTRPGGGVPMPPDVSPTHQVVAAPSNVRIIR